MNQVVLFLRGNLSPAKFGGHIVPMPTLDLWAPRVVCKHLTQILPHTISDDLTLESAVLDALLSIRTEDTTY